MQVSPVTNNVNFNGSVHKSVVNYIEKNVNNDIKVSLEVANNAGLKVNRKKLTSLKEQSNQVLEKLNNYMKKMHPDTELVCNSDLFHPSIWLRNGDCDIYFAKTTLKPRIEDQDICMVNQKPIINKHDIKNFTYSVTQLVEKMKLFADEFCSFDPKLIDEVMYESKKADANYEIFRHYDGKGFIKLGIQMRKSIKSFYEFANYLKREDEAKLHVSEKIKEYKDKIAQQKKQDHEKEIIKQQIRVENNKFIKELLK